MLYIREHYTPMSGVASIITIFARPWIAMLALGALGHRLDIPALFINYWTVMLAYLAVRAFIGTSQVNKWVAGENLARVKKAATKENEQWDF